MSPRREGRLEGYGHYYPQGGGVKYLGTRTATITVEIPDARAAASRGQSMRRVASAPALQELRRSAPCHRLPPKMLLDDEDDDDAS